MLCYEGEFFRCGRAAAAGGFLVWHHRWTWVAKLEEQFCNKLPTFSRRGEELIPQFASLVGYLYQNSGPAIMTYARVWKAFDARRTGDGHIVSSGEGRYGLAAPLKHAMHFSRPKYHTRSGRIQQYDGLKTHKTVLLWPGMEGCKKTILGIVA